MPFETEKPGLNTSLPTNKLPEEKEELGFTDVIGDAFHIDNPVVGAFKDKDLELDPESTFDPIERARQDGLPIDVLDQLTFVDNEKEYREAISQIESDLKARQRIAEAGLGGIGASMLAAGASPSIFLGGGSAIAALKAGKSVAKTAGITAGVVGSTVYAEEKLLQSTQAGRTDEEVAINTAAGFLLSGLLAGAGTALSNSRISSQASKLKGQMLTDLEVGDIPKNGLGDFANFNDSVGAASAKLTKDQLGLKKADNKIMQPVLDGYVKLNKMWNPAVRMMTSQSKAARQFFLDMADTSLKPQAVAEGIPLQESIEGALKRRHGGFAKEIDTFRNGFKEYKKGGGRLKFDDFRKEVGRAFHLEETHPDPQVQKAVDQFHSYYDKLAKELVDEGLMPEDILTPRDGSRYLNRIWNREMIKADPIKFKKTIEPYMRRQLTKIKTRVMSQMDQVDAKGNPTPEARLAAEDFRKFFDEDEFEGYLKDSIDDVADNLMKVNDIVGFQPPVAGAKGPLKKRSFNIPDKEVIDYLDTDILFLSDTYTRQVVPEIELKKRFGDKTFNDFADEVKREYNDAIEANPSKTAKLMKEREEVLRDMETSYNLIRGTYRGFAGPMDSRIKRASEAILTYNYMTSLGGVAISSLPDMGMGVLRRGFGNFFGKSLKPFIKDVAKTAGKMSRTEAKSYGQAMEYVTSLRSQSLYSIGDPMAFGGTPFERFINTAGNKMSNVNLINQWNDMWQTANTLGVRFRIVNNIMDQARGKKITAKEREWLNFVGLSDTKMNRMFKQIEAHGKKDPNGDIIPVIDNWADKDLANAFKAAVGKEIDRTVITKGATDIPRFGNTLPGKIIFQWQNFNFAFNNKVIISALQDADGQVAMGLATLVTMGMLTEVLKAKSAGRPLPENPGQWLEAGLDRSGLLGLVSYGNSYAELAGLSYKQLLGEDAPRPGGRSALDTAFGPTGKALSNARLLGQAAVKATKGDGFTQKDLHRLRVQTPGQNIFYIKDILDKIEKEIGESLDLPETRK
jgi:hypothetical protein